MGFLGEICPSMGKKNRFNKDLPYCGNKKKALNY
jgi:hypothetical protein